MFSGAHLHLLFNHAPIFAMLFALGLLVLSLFMAKDVLRRTAFLFIIVGAITGVVANKSGDAAEDAIRGFPGVQRKIIHDHEEMGDKAFILGDVLGVIALVMLIRWRRKPVPGSATLIMLLATAFVSGAFVYTGLLGGRVRHTEVRPGTVKGDELKIEPRPVRPPPEGG